MGYSTLKLRALEPLAQAIEQCSGEPEASAPAGIDPQRMQAQVAKVAATVAKGYDEATVRRVWKMLDRAEYKRRQAPPGVKLRPKSFGRDRRTPITSRWRG